MTEEAVAEDDKAGAKPEWKHDEDLSLRRVVPALHTVREALEKALSAERAKLAELVGVRDSLKK